MKAKLLHDEASRQKRVREEAEEEQTNSNNKNKKKPTNTSVKKSKKTEQDGNESTVIYLGHIPHGFYERQMYTFFGQFGKVSKVKLFRNPKTKKSRGYAYLKFELPEVASEVSAAMNGYFLQDRKLKCEIVPLDRQHEGMFLPPKKSALPVDVVEADDDDVVAPVKPMTEKQQKDQNKKQKRLIAMGIDFDLSAVLTVVKPTEKPAAKPTEKPASKPAEKPAAKPTEKPATKPTEKPAAKSAAKSVVKPSVAIQADKPLKRTAVKK